MADSEQPNEGEVILYQTPEGSVRIEVHYESETFWLNQKKIAELFGVDVRTVSYHLKEIYDSKELSPEATLQKNWIVQTEGNREVRREIEFYNLDAIISVGYRVNSAQATQFRIWATQKFRGLISNIRFANLTDRIREIVESQSATFQTNWIVQSANNSISEQLGADPLLLARLRLDSKTFSIGKKGDKLNEKQSDLLDPLDYPWGGDDTSCNTPVPPLPLVGDAHLGQVFLCADVNFGRLTSRWHHE